ncbi:MAG: hypothetical protein HXY50_05810 [Ignavibacteriaceae bacterium]|nr:hypothetical protein [Ignavibacteriaceae bacterium]
MLSNNFYFAAKFFRLVIPGLMVANSFIFLSCENKQDEKQDPAFSVYDTLRINDDVKKMFGKNFKAVLHGNFDEDSLQEVAVGIELTENNNWGIKFILLEATDNRLIKKFETELLDGSFNESVVSKLRISSYNYDFVYYNSQDYFWGSGGGEVFSYIIDFNSNSTYYAHLFSEMHRQVELFLSKNITVPEIKDYFISTFRKDYPEFRLSSQDVSLDY